MEFIVTVNGAARTVPSGCTVAHLLEILEIDPRRVAVERNRDVVPRQSYGATHVEDGDQIEVVTFVGGG
ncbi:MAG: sulfur carrier protein ThiS [Myxococcales bacterium]|nr:sulfur carrier protein ThiS [Myxococcales bacterium]